MNAERLHAIVKRLKAEMDQRNLVGTLQSLEGGLRSVSQAPNTANQQNLASYRTSMFEATADSGVDQFSPAWRQILRELGGEEFFGSTLKRKIETTLAENQMTPAVAADQLETLREEMAEFKAALDQSASAFSTFKLGDEELEPGECEIGMLIPRAAINDRLTDFTKELEELSFILNTFAEVATGQLDDLEIKALSSSNLMVYLKAGWRFAECLAKAIERVVGLYKGLLGLRKSLEELKDQGVPDQSAKGVQEYANQHMEKGIERVSIEIVSEFYKDRDDGRRNELKTQVRISLNAIANRIDRGYNIEVRSAPLATDDTEQNAKQRAAIAAVQAASANMQYLNLEGQPILQLPEPKPQDMKAKSSTGNPVADKLKKRRGKKKQTAAEGSEVKS
jgi:hypothetical protein